MESIFFSITLTLIHIGGPMQRVGGYGVVPPPHYIKLKKNVMKQGKKKGKGKKKERREQECKLHSFLIMF